MGSFLSKWYNEGIVTPPPPCMQSKSFYACLSENACCRNSFGKIGFNWAEKNRAPLMFSAFTVSFIAFILICAAMGSLSTSASVVKNVPFFTGKLTITNETLYTNEGLSGTIDYYAGLSVVVYEGCETGANCPPHTQSWDDVTCNNWIETCDECKDAATGSISTLILALITQLPQITTDIQRSAAAGDLHCQKAFGIITGIIGTLTTLAALNTFADVCYRDFSVDVEGVKLEKSVGPAFYLLLFATLLKIFDVIIHFIVPTPEQGYWTPDGPGMGEGIASGKLKTVDVERAEEEEGSGKNNQVL
mmetsp:Transcript_10104/g.16601  ORF Transcript_10104/g.16601 Transcript_10104/m.16601 type:complete len:304 (-) Transcript_10104:528-1439(-)